MTVEIGSLNEYEIEDMREINIEMIRTDKVKIELDENYFNEEWFEDFRTYMYDYDSLAELAEYIAYNVVHNSATFIDGIGIPLKDGKKPLFLEDGAEINEHVNVIYNAYNTDVEYETEDDNE